MRVKIPGGKYVLAVSGGVDSMSLMHLLTQQQSLELVVTHFNHGIRPEADATADEHLVKHTALNYGLDAEFGYGHLGPDTNEETARIARYSFLEKVRKKHSAQAIITAHQQDDLIETAFLNLLRGSGRRGLSAIINSSILRPLINVPKSEILAYARKNELVWREDKSNNDERYLRNYLRKVLVGMSAADRSQIVNNVGQLARINKAIEIEIATLSHNVSNQGLIDRAKFIALPQDINEELVMYWLRGTGFLAYDKKTVYRLVTALKTARARTTYSASKVVRLEVGKKTAHFVTTD